MGAGGERRRAAVEGRASGARPSVCRARVLVRPLIRIDSHRGTAAQKDLLWPVPREFASLPTTKRSRPSITRGTKVNQENNFVNFVRFVSVGLLLGRLTLITSADMTRRSSPGER